VRGQDGKISSSLEVQALHLWYGAGAAACLLLFLAYNPQGFHPQDCTQFFAELKFFGKFPWWKFYTSKDVKIMFFVRNRTNGFFFVLLIGFGTINSLQGLKKFALNLFLGLQLSKNSERIKGNFQQPKTIFRLSPHSPC